MLRLPTMVASGHRHIANVSDGGNGSTSPTNGHTHNVRNWSVNIANGHVHSLSRTSPSAWRNQNNPLMLADGDSAELRLINALNRDYQKRLFTAAKSKIAGLPSGDLNRTQIKKVLSEVTATMDGVSPEVTDRLLSNFISARGLDERKRNNRRLARGKPKIKVAAVFTEADRRLLAAVSDQQAGFVRGLWSFSHRKIVQAAAAEVIAAGRVIDKRGLAKLIEDVVGGVARAPKVAGAFSGSSPAYFKVISATARNRGANYGALSSFRDFDVQRYRVTAVLDNRTSDICKFMDGKVFSVSTGLSLAEKVSNASSREDLRKVAGWRSVEEARRLGSATALSNAGLSLPPYHGNCRTFVVAVSR